MIVFFFAPSFFPLLLFAFILVFFFTCFFFLLRSVFVLPRFEPQHHLRGKVLGVTFDAVVVVVVIVCVCGCGCPL